MSSAAPKGLEDLDINDIYKCKYTGFTIRFKSLVKLKNRSENREAGLDLLENIYKPASSG